jgi:hypothetical protein
MSELFWPFFIAFHAVYGLVTLLFFWRRQHPIIKQRQPITTLLLSIHCWALSFFLFSGLHVGYEWSCFIHLIGYYFFGYTSISLMFLRCGNLLFVYFIHNAVGNDGISLLQTFSRLELLLFRFQSHFQQVEQDSSAESSTHLTTSRVQSELSLGSHSNLLMDIARRARTERLLAQKYRKDITFMSMVKVICSTYTLAILLLFASYFITGLEELHCQLDDLILHMPFIIFVMFIMNPLLIFTIRRVDDSLGIRLELQMALGCFSVLYLLAIISLEVIALQPRVGSAIWIIVYLIIQQIVLLLIPAIRSMIPHRNIHHTTDSFHKVLANSTLKEQFKKILAKDFCSENMVFYEAVEKIKKKETPIKISFFVNNFFKHGAEFELNLSAKDIKNIRSRLLEQKEDPRQVLIEVQHQVFQLMYQNNFRNFLALCSDK